MVRSVHAGQPAEVALFAVDLDGVAREADCGPRDARDADRAARFRFDVHRRRYLAGRLVLRRLLADALGVRLEAVLLGEDAGGKPCLVEPAGALHFNVSHSGGAALIALSDCAPVGVDIEVGGELGDADLLAGECLSATELEAWRDMLAGRERRFLDLWTRKEALLKAIGLGLGISPSSFSTGFGPEPVSLVVQGLPVDVWSLALDDPGHAAAVALHRARGQGPD